MFAGKPIIGIIGGIGSGKSFVADLFGEFGCLVIHSDELVDAAYRCAEVHSALREWWGAAVFDSRSQIDRKAIANKVFSNPVDRVKLEGLLFPVVFRRRLEIMEAAAEAGDVKAFVWDSPLLLETGLNWKCDIVVFVHAPEEIRLYRVNKNRGWDRAELARREKLQYPLDKKREISEYVIDNTADADYARDQVSQVLSRIRGPSARDQSA